MPNAAKFRVVKMIISIKNSQFLQKMTIGDHLIILILNQNDYFCKILIRCVLRMTFEKITCDIFDCKILRIFLVMIFSVCFKFQKSRYKNKNFHFEFILLRCILILQIFVRISLISDFAFLWFLVIFRGFQDFSVTFKVRYPLQKLRRDGAQMYSLAPLNW